MKIHSDINETEAHLGVRFKISKKLTFNSGMSFSYKSSCPDYEEGFNTPFYIWCNNTIKAFWIQITSKKRVFQLGFDIWIGD